MPVNDATKWYDKGTGEPADGYITPSDAQEAIKQIYLDLATVAQVVALTTRVDGQGTNLAALQSAVQGLASPGELKPPVPSEPDLPTTGNNDGDIIITLDDGHLHVWVGNSWTDIGPVATDKVPDGGNTGDIIMWDGNVGEWQAVEPLLSQLHDVDGGVIPNDGDVLLWDAARGLWVMDAPPMSKATTTHREAVIDYTSTPPVLTAMDDDLGKLYIVKATGTGAWAGLDNHVVEWDGTKWVDRGLPILGEARFDMTGGKIMKWTATGWQDVFGEYLPLTGGTLTGPLTIAPTVAPVGRSNRALMVDGAIGFSDGNSPVVGALRMWGSGTGWNVMVGTGLEKVTSARGCTGVGYQTLTLLTEGTHNGRNTAIGNKAGASLATGEMNTFIGSSTAAERTSGDRNTIIGAGFSSPGGSATGSDNVCLGVEASKSSGPAQSRTVLVGNSTASSADDTVAIGHTAHATTAKTVQLLPNTTTGGHLFVGAEEFVSVPMLKALTGVHLTHNDVVQGIVAAPPTLTATDNGKAYIVGPAATGAFAGKDGQVATWDGATWTFAADPIDTARHNVGDGKTYWYTAAGWVAIPQGMLPLTGGTLTGPLTVNNSGTGPALTLTTADPVLSAVNLNGLLISANNPNGTGGSLRISGSSRHTASGALGNATVIIGPMMAPTLTPASRYNVAIGTYGGPMNDAQDNVAIGYMAAKKQEGSGCIFIGSRAGVPTAVNGGEVHSSQESVFLGAQSGLPVGDTTGGGRGAIVIGARAKGVDASVSIGVNTLAAPGSIAIGSPAVGAPTSQGAHTTQDKTVQLLPNTTTGAKVYAGADRLFSLTELKAVVAASADFNAFKTAMAALT